MSAVESVGQKVWALLAEAFGPRADVFKGGVPARAANDAFAVALSENYEPAVADEIAFHLVDWECDAAFVVAAILFPERFSKEELAAGADMLLCHVPAHVLAAARLAGHDTRDIFDESGET